jgi:L-alanine-DL-glutamate epimerase-like enolase superfamily enzyme
MKVGRDFGRAEDEDIRRVAAVRKALGNEATMYIDANNGYYAKQAIRLAESFKELNVGWFEEPVLADDIPGLAQVAANLVRCIGDTRSTVSGYITAGAGHRAGGHRTRDGG